MTPTTSRPHAGERGGRVAPSAKGAEKRAHQAVGPFHLCAQHGRDLEVKVLRGTRSQGPRANRKAPTAREDCNVYVRSRRAGERVMESLRRLYARLRLRVNEAKSAVARPQDRKFLGYSFWYAGGGEVRRRIAPKALEAMKERVREITTRSGGRSMDRMFEELRGYLVGWKGYFRLADTPGVFRDLDEWIRHRLRLVQLKQWKRGKTVFRELRARGVPEHVAAMAAHFARNWWRVAGQGRPTPQLR